MTFQLLIPPSQLPRTPIRAVSSPIIQRIFFLFLSSQFLLHLLQLFIPVYHVGSCTFIASLFENPQPTGTEKFAKMCYSIVVLIQLLILFPAFVLPFHLSIGNDIDRLALLAFKKGILIDPENVLGNWNETTHVCQWNGIGCGRNPQRVVKLDLKSKSLVGTISPFLSNLSYLVLLELSDNSFHGPLPKEFGALSSLELLGLQGNEIQHEVPHSFGKLTKLRYIDLSNNQFRGMLPTSLFYNCTQLAYVDLSNNSFIGLIPSQIGNHLLLLENLLLYSNQLTGGIPPSLSNSTQIVEIDHENNFLNCTLPSETLMHMTSLQILHLSCNNFLSNSNNSDLNPFFSSISNLTHLVELELAGNHLGGELPPNIGLLGVNLSELYLNDNLIHGEIPLNISNLSNLISLNLSNNLLNGTVPSEIIRLPNLQRLWLSKNLLQGDIPSLPSLPTNLGLLDISRNKLSGSIPNSLSNLNQLRVLMLNGNLLSGCIPSNLGNVKLELLDLSYNRLTGSIPPEVASLRTMAIYFNLSHNLLEGTIPMELSKMDKVQAIDLSSNNFSGNIPPNLEGCEVVELVNLSNNSLHGPLPGTLGSLLSLRSLDLSHNFLSGEIPASLQDCRSLRQLDLSYNNFSGALPQGGIFECLTLESMKGNHFCGSLHGLPSCHSTKRSIIHSPIFLALLISFVSISAFFLTIFFMVGYKKIRNITSQRNDSVSGWSSLGLSSTYPRISYKELVQATGGFEESRLIGSGSVGRVYRGVLNDGSIVAVKVLQLQTTNSRRTFDRECQILKRIRHRNLMRIITVCSLPDFKALVLPFMANGSLESHLHPQSLQSNSLNLSLIQRVRICKDIAEGMAYLHHHSPLQVIHCDLKPSNILLNDDMTALVSDFGISRLVMTASEGNMIAENTANSTVHLLCGSIGYMAPEYGYGRTMSIKNDVYSFGIIVLEMVTRKRPTDEMFSDGLSLPKWVRKHYNDQVEKVIDSSLLRDLWDQSPEIKDMWEVAIMELLDLGLLCTQENPSTRPTMLDVADDLDRLKRYLGGDTTATFTSSHGISSSTIATGDYW